VNENQIEPADDSDSIKEFITKCCCSE